MSKKILSILLAVIMAFSIAPVTTFAAEDITSYLTYEISNGEVTITDCDRTISGDITIPDTIEGYPVTKIGSYAFENCTSLTGVIIPDSVTAMYVYAFRSCTSLVNVTISHSLTVISSYTFYGCKNLVSVTIPNSVTSIFSSAFKNCSNLTRIIIPNSVTSIDSSAFYGCTRLTSITIPDSVTSIGDDAFYNTAYYNDASNWENGVLWINNHLFKVKGTITGDYEIKQGTVTIGSYAFEGCDTLTSVTIPDSVISIGSSAFSGCSNLTSITIPDSVTSIGSFTFEDCTSLASITIPYSVTSIGSFTFSGCASLTNITIPDGVTSIGSSAFYDCTSLTNITIPNGVTTIGEYTFSGCSSLESVTIPDSVTSIGSSAFSSCKNLVSVTIPDSVTSIGNNAFSYCYSLTRISVDENNTRYSSDEYGVLFDKNKTELIQYPVGNGRTAYVIPDSVTIINRDAFSGCTSLASVTIPDSVTSIGNFAFEGCKNLVNVTIPNSVTSIGNFAFRDCTSLAGVTIPDSVISIGSSAFQRCTSLASIAVGENNANYSSDEYGVLFNKNKTELIQYPIGNSRAEYTIPDSVTSIGYGAFEDCASLVSVTIPGSVISIGSSVFRGCSNLTSITIPNSVTSIGSGTFFGCTSLTNITIPDSVTTINDDVFCYCTSLTNATISKNVVSIGDSAFFNCDSLKNITLPESLESLGFRAFYGCDSLETINIPKNVSSIDYCVFEACGNLKSITIDEENQYFADDESGVLFNKSMTKLIAYPAGKEDTSYTIPSGVTFIEEYAFSHAKLNSLIIPKSLRKVGIEPLYGCDALTDVYYCGTLVEWNNVEILHYSNRPVYPKAYYYDNFAEKTMHYEYCAHKNTQVINAADAKCNQNGYTGDTYCNDCESVISLGEVIIRSGHNEVWTVQQTATCTENGIKVRTCSVCNEIFEEVITAATGHNEVWTVQQTATCTENGIKVRTCSVCNEIFEEVITAATGHTEEVVPGREATYYATGLTEGKKCSVCGEILVAQEEIPMLKINVPNSITVGMGETVNLDIAAYPDSGMSAPLYTSTNEAIVKVDSYGNITGVIPGYATVIVDLGNGDVRTIFVTVIAGSAFGSAFGNGILSNYICFAKTDGIGWYKVSKDGGQTYETVFGNTTYEVEVGTELVIKACDITGDSFEFFVNGNPVKPDDENKIFITVSGYMLINALSYTDITDNGSDDSEESLNWFQKIINAIKNFFKRLFGL